MNRDAGACHAAGVLFDLDGTMLDSAPDLVGALNWVRAQDGLQAKDVSELSPYASRGALGLINAGYPTDDPDLLETRRLSFLKYYADNSFKHSRLYDGILDLVEFLNTSAIPWGIVTNKIESLTLPILQASGLSRTVGPVVCGDTVGKSKPDPEPVLLACEILQLKPSRVLFVGDDVRDIEAGWAAGTMTAAALYGYGAFELNDVHRQGSYLLDKPSSLRGLLEIGC